MNGDGCGRKRGLVLNMGTMAGAIGSPMLATYSASKAFIATFSTAIGEEVKEHGIVVEHVNTYFVVSPLVVITIYYYSYYYY
jgi:17beta-estradiol 17-dehydrogenase / very-long-chain 3-oxoacyl-CoA reductase